MKTTNNTVLITGGGSGIGFATAKLLSENGNRVIITGRNEKRLEEAVKQLPGVTAIPADVTDAQQVKDLVQRLEAEFPELNVVMNNAGKAIVYPLTETENVFAKGEDEMLTNYLSVLRLNELLLPLLQRRTEAAIINVSSVVAYVPVKLVTYSASKAALHSYTQSLRLALAGTPVKVFELFPPLVNTDMSREIGGENGVPPSFIAEAVLEGLAHDTFEIRPGQTEEIYQLHRTSPQEALQLMNA